MNFKNTRIPSIFLLLLFLVSFASGNALGQQREIYELKIYHLDNQQQESQLDTYLKNSYIPALQKAGINKVGVFKPIEGDSLYGKRVFVLTPYQSMEQILNTSESLEKDTNYLTAGKSYINASHDNPPYERFQTVILKAFEGMPQFTETNLTNAPEQRIYELRSYESATESLFHNKVAMFNKGEIDIFKKLEFNPIFFGEVIAGDNMPNLMYMTSFKDMDSRDAHWDAFGKDPDWEKMSSLKVYEHNVSHIDIFLLHPTPYSGI